MANTIKIVHKYLVFDEHYSVIAKIFITIILIKVIIFYLGLGILKLCLLYISLFKDHSPGVFF